jgi:acetyl esterase/lipase
VVTPDGPLSLDIHRPAEAGVHPVVIQIYGGAWQRGAPGDDAAFSAALASAGYVVFAIDYRHAPQWRFPSELDDVDRALAWIRRNASNYGGDSTAMAVIGRSSGAELALLAAFRADSIPVRAVVSYYGPVDLTAGYRHPPVPDPLAIRSIETAYLGGDPDQVPDQYRAASPITHVRPGLPPALLIYGARDHVVEPRFGHQLHDALVASGDTAILLEIPWAEHAFDAVPGGPGSQLALYHVERFLAWAFARGYSPGRC